MEDSCVDNIRSIYVSSPSSFWISNFKPCLNVTRETSTYNWPREKTGLGRCTSIYLKDWSWLLLIVIANDKARWNYLPLKFERNSRIRWCEQESGYINFMPKYYFRTWSLLHQHIFPSQLSSNGFHYIIQATDQY